MNKHLTIFLLSILSSIAPVFICFAHEPDTHLKNAFLVTTPASQAKKNLVHTIVVELGPYDLRRQYKIMEGPYASATFRVGGALGKTIRATDEKVHFVEDEQGRASVNSVPAERSKSPWSHPVAPLVTPHNKTPPMSLYWFRGARVDVVDENNQVLPSPTYLCHGKISVFSADHKKYFPHAALSADDRLCLFTQGCNVIMLPEGFGVPIAAGEEMKVSLKALNTTNEHKRIKLRCTIYLLSDRELSHPISALRWQVADLMVTVSDRQSQTNRCRPSSSVYCRSSGRNAPNNVTNWLETTEDGETLTGHWIVPPGVHTFCGPIIEKNGPRFNSGGPIHAVWAHVHPFCETVSLIESYKAQSRSVFTIHCQTTTSSGAGLKHIDLICTPQGLPLNQHAKYFLVATYNNTSGQPQDAMAITGIFFRDPRFKKPYWSASSAQHQY